MKITIESTSNITDIDGVPVRHWQGVTEEGVECHVFVHRIAVKNDLDAGQFERELKEMDPPTGPRHVDLRLLLD